MGGTFRLCGEKGGSIAPLLARFLAVFPAEPVLEVVACDHRSKLSNGSGITLSVGSTAVLFLRL